MVIKQQKKKGKGKSGTRKYGRNAEKCKRYRDRGIRQKNKRREAEKRKRKFERRRMKRLKSSSAL